MDNLNVEELKQLVTFYRQRLNEVEFSGLQNQLLITRFTNENANLKSQNLTLQSNIDSLNEKIKDLNAQIEKKKNISKSKK